MTSIPFGSASQRVLQINDVATSKQNKITLIGVNWA